MNGRSPIPFIGFAARSGTGKTTLLKKLIPLLRARGLRVGTIKRSHHDIQIDREDDLSRRLREAGAAKVLLISAERSAVIEECDSPREPALDELLAELSRKALDLILVEGFRDEAIPKIELHRPSLGFAPLYPEDPFVVAVATDSAPPEPCPIPVLDLNDPAGIADFVQRYLGSR